MGLLSSPPQHSQPTTLTRQVSGLLQAYFQYSWLLQTYFLQLVAIDILPVVGCYGYLHWKNSSTKRVTDDEQTVSQPRHENVVLWITGSDPFLGSVVVSIISRSLNDLELFYLPPRSSTRAKKLRKVLTSTSMLYSATLPEEMARLCAKGGMTKQLCYY